MNEMCHMADFDPNRSAMVLKADGLERTYWVLFGITSLILGYRAKILYNMGTYSGHLWCEFQWAAASIVEVTMLFVCFLHLAKFAHR